VDLMTMVSSQNTNPVSTTRAFVDLAGAIDRNVSSDRAAELLANFRTAVRAEHRAEVLSEVADWLYEVGEKEAAYLLRTVDVPGGAA
jgi:hypothetical protein